MKWQNLTNKIFRLLCAVLVIVSIWPANILPAQDDARPPLLLKKCWESDSTDPTKFIAASDNELQFILATAGGKVDLFETKTGNRIWRSEFGGEIITRPIADKNTVFFAVNPVAGTPRTAETTLRAISIDTGILIWSKDIPYIEESFLLAAGDEIIVVGHDGSVVSLRKNSGERIWQAATGKNLAGDPLRNEKVVLLPLESQEIVTIAAATGKIENRTKTDRVPTSIILFDDQTLVWGDKKGHLVAVDFPSGAEKWKFKNGGAVSGVVSTKNGILITSYDNFVYLMSPGGRVIWKRRLSGRVVSEPVVTDQFAMVTILGEAGVSFIDLENGKTLNKIVDGDEYGTVGPIRLLNSVIYANSAGLFSYSLSDCAPK
jgi:outer membrane protein assembly factor BamB